MLSPLLNGEDGLFVMKFYKVSVVTAPLGLDFTSSSRRLDLDCDYTRIYRTSSLHDDFRDFLFILRYVSLH